MSKDRIVKPGKGGKTDPTRNPSTNAKAKKKAGSTLDAKKQGTKAKAPKAKDPGRNTSKSKPMAKTRVSSSNAVAPTYHAVLADRDMLSGSFLSIEEAKRIASFDLTHAQVSSDPKYAEDNVWQYYYAINLWLHVVFDQHPRNGITVMRYLRDYIRQNGLLATIRRGKTDASNLVRELEPEHLTFLLEDLDLQGQLQALRFLKRFTPLDTNLLYDRALNQWLEVERVCQNHNHRNYVLNTRYDYVMTRVREYLAKWCKNYRSVEETKLSANLVVPSGGTFEKKLNYHDRLVQIAGGLRDKGRFLLASTPSESSLFYRDIGIQPVDDKWPTPRRGQLYLKRYNRLILVPKTADAPRIVCPESPLNQTMQRLIRDNLESCVPKWVRDHLPCRDQSVMERAAEYAVRNHLTTTDLSHASDSVTLRHILDAFPPKVARDLKEWRPTHTILPDGTVHELQQFSTMGTGNVWYVMAMFLLALECVACDLECVPSKRKNQCYAFGDDMIHPSEVTDTLYWVLQMLGFVVNVDKSFGDGSKYRESCGSEWWSADGETIQDLRTLYYPRFPISCKANKPRLELAKWDYDPLEGRSVLTDTLSRMTELQHQLYHQFPTASDFLTSCILQIEPSMTTSVAGSVCNDLWGPFESGVRKDITSLCAGKPPVWINPDTGLEEPVTTRVGHLSPVVVAGGHTQDTDLTAEWRYLSFLRQGPMKPSDPWLAVNGCTESVPVVDFTDLTILWKVKF
jgi:hypothetical protein